MSDTMPHDIEWVLNEMCDGANKSLNGGDPDPILCKYGQKWKDFVKDSILLCHCFINNAHQSFLTILSKRIGFDVVNEL